MLDQVIPQSAGSLSVVLLALMMAIVQLVFIFRKPQLTSHGWGAAISFAGMLYAAGVFFEYNTLPGPINRFAGLLEFTAHVLLIHSLYGLTFACLGINGRRYHLFAGIFHILVLILLWSSTLIVSDRFVSHNFFWMAQPFTEPALGPLGSIFILYIAGAAIGNVFLWFKNKCRVERHRIGYLSGIIFWILLGIHDGLAALGMPTIQYIMEYGFFGFSAVVLWNVFDNYADLLAEDKYRVITEFTNDGILLIQNNKTVFENPACSALFGRPVNDLRTRDFLDHVIKEDKKKLTAYYDRLQDGGAADGLLITRIRRQNGEEKILEIQASMITYRNRPAILTVMCDITERIREEAALKDREEKLLRLKKMESLALLAGGVAHDLNNVLSGIVSYPDLMLLDLPQDSKLRRPLETIRKSGLRAAAIVQDLLTIARGVPVVKEPFNINAVIDSYLTSPEHKKLMQYHPEVTVAVNLDPRLLNIQGSPTHMRKVIMNLVSNASEAIEEQGIVVLSTTNRYIDRPLKGYETIDVGEYVVLTVADNGQGISDEDLGHIFEPFYTKKVMGRSGTGLGLTVVWNVVLDHNGYIDVSSDERGAKFELYFPATREEAMPIKPPLPFENLQGKHETILVIDDEKTQREISCRMLEALGYKTAAVEYLKHNRADLLLLDMIMEPGIGGRETYERIGKIHPGQKAVIVSGFAETEMVEETQKMGAGRYLKKPLLLEELAIAVKEELAK